MSYIADFIRLKVAEALGAKAEDINANEEFISMGLDSMHAIFLIDEIEKEFKIEINPHSFWEYPTIHSFSSNLQKQLNS
jgi:acyl carrier protein